MFQAGRIPRPEQGTGCWLVSLQDKEKDEEPEAGLERQRAASLWGFLWSGTRGL